MPKKKTKNKISIDKRMLIISKYCMNAREMHSNSVSNSNEYAVFYLFSVFWLWLINPDYKKMTVRALVPNQVN